MFGAAHACNRSRLLDPGDHAPIHSAIADDLTSCAQSPRCVRTPRSSKSNATPGRIFLVVVSALLSTGTPHLPDLVFLLDDGRAVAVEVELSAKPVRIYELLLVAYGASRFAGLHYWTANPTIATRLNSAARRVGVPTG